MPATGTQNDENEAECLPIYLKLRDILVEAGGRKVGLFLVAATPSTKLITDSFEHTKLWHSLRGRSTCNKFHLLLAARCPHGLKASR
jgi:hypothetical protein